MALDPAIKKRWVELQKQQPYPVNALGVRIDEAKEAMLLKVWKLEGLDQFIKK